MAYTWEQLERMNIVRDDPSNAKIVQRESKKASNGWFETPVFRQNKIDASILDENARQWQERVAPKDTTKDDLSRESRAESVTIILEGEVPISWNKFYAGVHWSERSAEKKRVKRCVQAALTGKEQVFAKPVRIVFTAYFEGRRLDPDNVCGKLYIDALKDVLLENDSSVQVRSVLCECLCDKSRPRLEIKLSISED
jgi:hypothetical protein